MIRLDHIITGQLLYSQYKKEELTTSSGVEASSSASLAAYLNSLQFSIEDSQAWFAKGSGWRVTGGTYWYVSLIQVMRQEEVADEVAASMLSQEWISGWT
jgi:hypothetical protein